MRFLLLLSFLAVMSFCSEEQDVWKIMRSYHAAVGVRQKYILGDGVPHALEGILNEVCIRCLNVLYSLSDDDRSTEVSSGYGLISFVKWIVSPFFGSVEPMPEQFTTNDLYGVTDLAKVRVFLDELLVTGRDWYIPEYVGLRQVMSSAAADQFSHLIVYMLCWHHDLRDPGWSWRLQLPPEVLSEKINFKKNPPKAIYGAEVIPFFKLARNYPDIFCRLAHLNVYPELRDYPEFLEIAEDLCNLCVDKGIEVNDSIISLLSSTILKEKASLENVPGNVLMDCFIPYLSTTDQMYFSSITKDLRNLRYEAHNAKIEWERRKAKWNMVDGVEKAMSYTEIDEFRQFLRLPYDKKDVYHDISETMVNMNLGLGLGILTPNPNVVTT